MSLSLDYGKNRDSFGRLGDDLCELILSYLPLSDCFRLQCVSKQFNALILNGQTKLVITCAPVKSYDVNAIIGKLIVRDTTRNDYYNNINDRLLNIVLKKCANITSITIDCIRLDLTDQTINVIIDNGVQLKRLTLNADITQITVNCVKRFGEKCLTNLVSIKSHFAGHSMANKHRLYDELMPSLIPYTRKLKSYDFIYKTQYFFDQNCTEIKQFWQRLETVKVYDIVDQRFTRFANNFGQQLKCLRVRVYKAIHFDILKHLADFERLECLDCEFKTPNWNVKCYDDVLKLIGVKCVKLKVLRIAYLLRPFYHVFRDGFRSLEKLIISCNGKQCESISLLSNCVNLKHLEFESTPLVAKDLKDIDSYLPQLKSIDIFSRRDTDAWYARPILKHLAKLSNLCDLKIGYGGFGLSYINTNNILLFLSMDCGSIRKIGIYPKDNSFDENRLKDYIQTNNRKIDIYSVDRNTIRDKI